MMTHRSNQAVASQDQALSQPEPPPLTIGRSIVGWGTALAALGLSTALLAGGIWLVRFPLGHFFLAGALSERGIDADFRFTQLDFSSATLEGVRFGDAADPDAAIERLEARWVWAGVAPQLSAIRLVSPEMRLRVDEAGIISAGALQRFETSPGRQRPSLPEIDLAIEDGRARIEAPFGVLEATFNGAGLIGRDFSLTGAIAPTTQSAPGFAIADAAATLTLEARRDAVTLRADAGATRLLWAGAELRGASAEIAGRAPLDLGRFDVGAEWTLASLRAPGLALDDARGTLGGGAASVHDRLAPAAWTASARFTAVRLQAAGAALGHARGEIAADGEAEHGRGTWRLAGQSFAGIGIESRAPSAAGSFSLDAERRAAEGDAHILLAQARLDQSAAQRLNGAFPALRGTPLEPSFAQARRALGTAGRSFALTAPLHWNASRDRGEINVAAPINVRAANGVRLDIAPLREDRSAAILQFPGATLNAALDVQISGGGAPRAVLLLDRLDWAPDAPLEADGALTIADWRAPGGAIAADELAISLALPVSGGGRIDLHGPARVSGPLGDGSVQDLRADLDLTAIWGEGWRVASNRGCLPTRFAHLETGGLRFRDGALSLCPQGGALIAADAGGRLSGGFVINAPRLNGAMRTGEPAQLAAASIAARFSGAPDAVRLHLDARTPTLSVDLNPARRLVLALASASAQARLGESWRVDGVFERGALSDPALPGAVSAIAGAWSMVPDNGRALIQVKAGEALVTAQQPASDQEAPLFNPVRLVGVDAIMREGLIEANGAVVLAEERQPLATFTARHNVSAGAGGARIVAAGLVFDQRFQPYQITERLRGVIDNARGGVDINADLVWDAAGTRAAGFARLHGVSLATATIPVVENVNGVVAFDDLFALTTPPGQRLSVGLVNPGIAVRDGQVQFQLLANQRVAIERAAFAYAAGSLSVAPTIVQLGEDVTRFELVLENVDAADLIQSLNIPDLAATGRLEGSFPLVLSRQNALVQNGVLRALPGGGTISYVGNAGQNASGAARVAFDALRSFRYEDLEITLNGDLTDEVVSSIAFSGENAGEAVDLGPIAPIPGLGNVRVRGVPFDFNVRVTAPFRRLAQTAASITDPGVILNNGRATEVEVELRDNPR
jgi:translocation and assembly module TamB